MKIELTDEMVEFLNEMSDLCNEQTEEELDQYKEYEDIPGFEEPMEILEGLNIWK